MLNHRPEYFYRRYYEAIPVIFRGMKHQTLFKISATISKKHQLRLNIFVTIIKKHQTKFVIYTTVTKKHQTMFQIWVPHKVTN